MDVDPHVPEGFRRHDRKSPVTDAWEPIYRQVSDETVKLGLRAATAHCNSRGFVHGGVISALADNVMGLACAHKMGGSAMGVSLLTVTLTVDFLGSAQTGQWLEFEPVFVKTGGTLCFVQAFVKADGAICARANSVFRAMRK
ncbi:MAG TPA: PaaI family thioesterase [Phenylobacterium sp.]